MYLLLTQLLATSATAADISDFPLDEALAELRDDRLFKTADVAVQVVRVEDGEEVWAHGADDGLNPASTTKVLTAATALENLGPAYTFTTMVAAASKPTAAGVVEGDLYVRGGGDPTMVIERLWKLARDLELTGVTKVEGDLVLDESFFGPDHTLPGWGKDSDRGPSYFPPISALSLNFNTVAIIVRPGAAPGKPAIVQLETPAGEYIQLTSTLKTGSPNSRSRIGLDRDVNANHTRFAVSGTVAQDSDVRRYYRTVGDPTRYFGEAFREVLADQDIEVTGKVRTGVLPDEHVELVTASSLPLTNVLMTMNKYSSNFMAEQVLRTVGAEVEGDGSTDAGLKVVHRYLKSIGVPEQAVAIKNGSGLAEQAKLSPAVLNSVLLDMAKNPRVGAEFRTSLAIAGWDGTLRRRLTDKPAQVRGKTGTLDGVHCLAGYVEADDGELYAFAFLVNGFRGGSSQVKRLHDAFARRMFEVTTDGAAVEETP